MNRRDFLKIINKTARDTGDRETRRDAYDILVHKYGIEAVGGWEIYSKKPQSYWTWQTIKEAAAPFKTEAELCNGHPLAYDQAKAAKMLGELYGKPVEFTLKEASQIASQYETLGAFMVHRRDVYNWACRTNVLALITRHMKKLMKHSLESVTEAASLCKSVAEFRKNYPKEYIWCKRHGHMASVCAGLKPDPIKQPVMDISKAVSSVSSYIELRQRFPEVYERMKRSGIMVKYFPEYATKDADYEKARIKQARASAKKFKTMLEFQNGACADYFWAMRHGILDEVCAHMPPVRKFQKHTLESAIEAGKTCTDYTDFKTRFKYALAWVKKHGHLQAFSEATGIKIPTKKEYVPLTYDDALAKAREYQSWTDFNNANQGMAVWLKESGNRERLLADTGFTIRLHKKRTLGLAKEAAKKYSTRAAFAANEQGLYLWALQAGRLDECCAHMKSGRGKGVAKPSEHHSIDRAKREASECSTAKEYRARFASSYIWASGQKVLPEVLACLNGGSQ